MFAKDGRAGAGGAARAGDFRDRENEGEGIG